MSYRPWFDHLESREVLSHAAPRPLITPLTGFPAASLGVSTVLPTQMIRGYGFDQTPAYKHHNAGAGQTIAIVDAFQDPGVTSEVAAFCTAAHLPPCHITEVAPDGSPGPDPQGNWPFETALDVEWAHALAPAASILLVDANGASLLAMVNAQTYALAHAHIISDSWGSDATSSDKGLDSFFQPVKGRATVLASAGDDGLSKPLFPADLPSVGAIGGTSFYVTAGGRYLSERLWPGSGPGGIVAFDADPATGVPVNVGGKWYQIGGTSLSCPCWAAVVALVDQQRAAKHLPPLSTADLKAGLRHLPARDFHAGHDIPGHGSPQVGRLVPDLANAKALPPVPPKHTQAVIPTVTVHPLFELTR